MLKRIATLILLGFIVGIGAGYYWAFQSYQPLKLAQENQELQAKYQALNRAYTREFSKDFLEVKK